ncbi:hypothetical protein BV25DRAFT_1910247 [Artomyces pyxidatus]|uniref:Uncharacterized protein n=1 Tax=Artomyces pyxidatus TaxID=48021 RepID=A0ACB8SEZ3_9AGAM|nr:hypothetical protein BV25DRAFT_1910247 [Artomyces pyxidatus]
MPRNTTFKPQQYVCPIGTTAACRRGFRSLGGLTRHRHTIHPAADNIPPPPLQPRRVTVEDVEEGDDDDMEPLGGPYVLHHPIIDGTPCDQQSNDLPPNTASPAYVSPTGANADNWAPFSDRPAFEIADLLYHRTQMPATHLNDLMSYWAASQTHEGDQPPFANNLAVIEALDSINIANAPWESFSASYSGKIPDNDPPPWMLAKYDVWFRDPRTLLRRQLGNPDFAEEIDYSPRQVFDARGKRQWSDFMTGNWAWKQADKIAEDENTHGAMFVPVILGSDKTTVSVATGQTEYWPLYISNGAIHNNVRRAHRNGVSLLGFLAIPKTDKAYAKDVGFRRFRRQLLHASLTRILQSLRPGMTVPEVTRCPDGHFRRVIYGLGPYIADYPEQVLLSCTVQNWCPRCTAHHDDLDGPGQQRSHEHTRLLTGLFDSTTLWNNYGIVHETMPFTASFPRADIHELLSPDILHQIIKGTFKDHLVTWVDEYLKVAHSPEDAAAISADIDRRIAAVPTFPGLRHFYDGRGYKQWTGDDSKALMKVYLPAIAGHVPSQMVQAISAFLDFCYLVRRSVIDEDTLDALDDALGRFHANRVIFETTGARLGGFSLPRQHSLKHFRYLIEQFAAPNGLCSSITESKHIKAVKEPWRRSSHFEALGQMLITNQRLDNIAAARVDFAARGMLDGPCVSPFVATVIAAQAVHDPPAAAVPAAPIAAADEEDGPVDGPRVLGCVTLALRPARGYPRQVHDLAIAVNQPDLGDLIRRFLYDQLNPHSLIPASERDIDDCPTFYSRISVFKSALAQYYTPSDLSGIGGMHRQRIQSVASWRHGPPRRDCIFIQKDNALPGMRGLYVAQAVLLFSFRFRHVVYPCALVHWFIPVSDEPDPDTGMWIVKPDLDWRGERVADVIHLDSVLRNAHLIPVYGEDFVPQNFDPSYSLHAYAAFYVNKFSDHHANETAF